MIFLETPRLFLRNLSDSDLDIICRYRSSEACARFQRWEDTSPETISTMIRTHQQDSFLSTREEQHYAIALSGNGCIGDVTFFFNPVDNCITLGITVAAEHQRQGYATELLSDVTAAIRRKYPTMDIVALIDPENCGSIRLFEKLGFERECYAPSISSFVYTLPGRRQP